jgi:hypothetical protein
MIISSFLNRLFVAGMLVAAVACSKDTTATVTPANGPIGTTTTLKTGTLKPENGTPTAGMVSVVRDSNNDEYLAMGSDFKSDFGTGTVAVYLAKAATNIKSQRTTTAGAPNGLGNVLALGFVSKNGQQYLKLPAASSAFSYVVFYCETVEINFGNASLQ